MKPCRICSHLERDFIDQLLTHGMVPRAIEKRIGGTTRRNLAHHRDVCLKEAPRE